MRNKITHQSRAFVLAAVLVLLVTTVTAGMAGVAAAQDGTNTTTATPTPGQTQTNTTSTATPTQTTPVPDGAVDEDSTVRLIPIRSDEKYKSVEVTGPGNFSVTGPEVLFESTEPVEYVSVREPGATAERYADGRMIRIAFEDDAAANGRTTLYHVEVIKANGESGVVRLRVTGTDVTVGSSKLDSDTVNDLLDDAEEHGYERSSRGVENLLEEYRGYERLVNHFIVEWTGRLIGWFILGARNPLVPTLALISGIYLLWWLNRMRGRVLSLISEDSGRTARLRRQFMADEREAEYGIADERLEDVPEIGYSASAWRDAFGVSTTYHLCELMHNGVTIELSDGEVVAGGVDELDASELHDSWLEVVTRPGRLKSPIAALDQALVALDRACDRHNHGHVYGDTRDKVAALRRESRDTRGMVSAARAVTDGGSANGEGGESA